jgi:transcriptional regulator with GAF, ATPase, and Fis domain
MTIFLTEYDLTADRVEVALDDAFAKVYATRTVDHQPDSFGASRKGLKDDSITDLADRGLSLSEAAVRLGMSPSGLKSAARRLGVKFADGRRKRKSREVRK